MNKFKTHHVEEVIKILDTAKTIENPEIKRLVTISALATATKNTHEIIMDYNADGDKAIFEKSNHIIDYYMRIFNAYEVDIGLAVEYFDDIVSHILYGV